MPRRAGRRAVRTVGRTAVIAGTATAVSGRVARRQQQAMIQDQQAAMAAAPPPQAPPPPAPAGATDAELDALARLGELHQQGVLTDEEFAAKKAQILGI